MRIYCLDLVRNVFFGYSKKISWKTINFAYNSIGGKILYKSGEDDVTSIHFDLKKLVHSESLKIFLQNKAYESLGNFFWL